MAISAALGIFAVFEALDAAASFAPRMMNPETIQYLKFDSLQEFLPVVFFFLIVMLAIVFLTNLIIWPIYRFFIGTKAGHWVYVVQNVRPRTFDAGEGISFDAQYGLKEARLCGYLKIKDRILDTNIPRADVHYYDEGNLAPGDFRGSWKSDDISISDEHIRIKYSISVKRGLDGEKEKKYTGYYLLEPSPDVAPLFGGEVWEGVVFTVNKFGGLFGLVYAERVPRRNRLLRKASGISLLNDHISSMFKRIRTPDKCSYIMESDNSPRVVLAVSNQGSDWPDLTT